MLKRDIENGDTALVDPAFRADVLDGFAAAQKAVPARWLYDRRGSELFEAITDLPEYYPTRTETRILTESGPDIAEKVGAGRAVVEFGSGSSAKTPLLLRAIRPAAYVPIDISGDFLRESAASLARDFPDLAVIPVEADFMEPIALPQAIRDLPKLGFFPGSTIGNLVPRTSVDLLRAMRESLGDDALLLIGMDRVKGEDVLVPAYDDAAGITAAFNVNLLDRINRELAGTLPVDAFRHRAIWNETLTRIEMHLEATRDVNFTIEGRAFSMKAGETIHTENSHKYGPRDARMLLLAGEWTPAAEWTDPDDRFALLLAEARPRRKAP
ncbi:MAG TPA: L-histidine N(alpha)-methyltransferase [Sphingomonas sp.]|nr:L-histidine N(alpha)-methyltransferase [Sphingomonas sp.]